MPDSTAPGQPQVTAAPRGLVWREGDRIRRDDGLGYGDMVPDEDIWEHAAEHLAKHKLGKVQFCMEVLHLRAVERDAKSE